jgi:glutamate decarboxylase
MPKQNYFLEIEPALQYGIEEQVMQLFATSSHGISIEEKMDVQVATLAQDFLGATNTSTDIEIDSFLEKFADSEVPIEPANVDSYLEYLANNVIAHSVRTSSPRFIGHMTSALTKTPSK